MSDLAADMRLVDYCKKLEAQIEQLTAEVEKWRQQYYRREGILMKQRDRYREAILDFLAHDKRETRAALRDLVGGYEAVRKHRTAILEIRSHDYVDVEYGPEFCIECGKPPEHPNHTDPDKELNGEQE